jgi:hypothetical protein
MRYESNTLIANNAELEDSHIAIDSLRMSNMKEFAEI